MKSIHYRYITAGILFAVSSLVMAAPQTVVADTAGAVIPLPDADRKHIEKLLGKGVVGEAVASSPLASPDTYLLHTGARSYQVLEKGKVSTETQTVEDTADALFTPGWHYTDGLNRGVFMQKTGDGNLVVVAEQDFHHKKLTRFTPGEPLIIAGVNPGESRQFTSKVDLTDLSDPTDVEHSGSLDITYTYIGTYSVKVPAGTYQAALIKWKMKGKVGPASIEDSYYRFIAPSVGLVAMIENKHISALLVYSDKTKLGKLLESSN